MRLESFRVINYRNVLDSGPIEVEAVTAFVGQNEAGKSNLFEALYRINPYKADIKYDADEDWPVDRFGEKASAPKSIVCEAHYRLDADEIRALHDAASLKTEETDPPPTHPLPETALLVVAKTYDNTRTVKLLGMPELDAVRVASWVDCVLPKFVFVNDYATVETTTELPQLVNEYFSGNPNGNWAALSPQEQSILVVLHLASVNLQQFVQLGQSPKGRTQRTYNKKQASYYLTEQFQRLWSQKKVVFDIDIDGDTLNIFVTDEGTRMPVPLNNRSTGFRWHVAFAWNFTYATRGQYKNCILLLEEPGIHLHLDGQQDLLKVFDELVADGSNQILYSTHLSSMIDPANPERVRIVETRQHHASVIKGVVSGQRRPMAVIEARLGLRGDLSGLLGDRKNLIVEGGGDLLILDKLSALLTAAGREGLSSEIYLWPAETATKTPMYAAFLIGNKWPGGVLVDKDAEGLAAKKKIEDNHLKEIAANSGYSLPILLLGDAAGIRKTDAAIEDLFPNDYFRELVNRCYGVNLADADLPVDGSTLIANRVESVLKARFNQELDKKRVLREMMKDFTKWRTVDDLPEGTASYAEALFKKINGALEATPPASGSVTQKTSRRAR